MAAEHFEEKYQALVYNISLLQPEIISLPETFFSQLGAMAFPTIFPQIPEVTLSFNNQIQILYASLYFSMVPWYPSDFLT